MEIRFSFLKRACISTINFLIIPENFFPKTSLHPCAVSDKKIITLSCQMQEVDDLMLRRFLRARNLDVEKASALFLKYLEWRCTAVPNGFISETEIKNELSHKEVFTQGFDKLGRPIVVYHPAKHFCSNREMDELKRKLSVYNK